MKFKTIFFLFNAFIIVSFLLISLVPLLFLGAEYSIIFWSRNWIISALFFLFIGALDAYFIYNWKLFTLLEKEDWPLLISYLEEEIYKKKRFTKRNLSLIINAYLSVSNLDKVKRLETEIRSASPKMLPQFALYLGTPYILENDLEHCVSYYAEFKDNPDVRFPGWIKWCYAFALVSRKEIEQAKTVFVSLLDTTKDDILILLTLYFLQNMDNLLEEEKKIRFSEKKKHFLEHYSDHKEWDKVIQKKSEENLLILLLSSLTKNAWYWITDQEPHSIS
jgi:hypothetical protein